MKYRVLASCAVVVLAACVQNPRSDNLIRICDDHGCSDRPKDQGTFEAASNAPDENADPRITALKAAAEKEPRAAYDLGLRYFRGDGVRQDSYQALVWMRKAGEAGNLQAEKALGSFYLFGLEEMGPDPREAEKWLMLAASRGDQESKKLLVQARADKLADAADYKRQKEERELYYGYWYSGYAYQGYWRQTAWYWY